jgi:hypothetical protein
MPKTDGEAKGFWNNPCMTAPLSAKEHPVHNTTISLGKRSSNKGFQVDISPFNLKMAFETTSSSGMLPTINKSKELNTIIRNMTLFKAHLLLIPIATNNFTFERMKAPRLNDQKAGNINQYAPLFDRSSPAALTQLKYEIICRDWYKEAAMSR